MDDTMLKKLTQVMKLEEQLRERCAAIIVPQLLNNMLLVEILEVLYEMKEMMIDKESCQCDTVKDVPKKDTKTRAYGKRQAVEITKYKK